ncbi:MAG TPA: AI-2E family transporter [Patescibacteria group bacterium]|nr:AI-2E family transporter [Patescibacteria group bacterium]
MIKKVEISHKTVIFTVFFLLGLWFLYFIKDIILQFFISLVIMASFNPIVTRLTKFRIPKVISVLLVYLVFFVILGFAVYAIIPALVVQTASFVSNLPKYLDNLGVPMVLRERVLSEFLVQIGGLPNQIAKASISVFSNVIGVFTVLIFAFYLLLSRDKFDDVIAVFMGEDKKRQISEMIDKLEEKLGGWARGELILMTIIGTLTYIGLTLLAIPFALPLAILAGIFEIIPIIGPTVSAIPSVVIGFGISPITGVAAASLAFLIQQVENYVFVPKIMQKSVGVNPIITLLSLAVGFRLSGILGGLIAIPVVITIQVLLKEYLASKE